MFKLESIDISFNRFTILENYTLYKLYIDSPLYKRKVKLEIAPYPIYAPLLADMISANELITLNFIRSRISNEDKRQLLTHNDLLKIKELSQEISQAILNQKTIEELNKLT